jgi:PIN domain nuclease of toxin-antitoxin system
MTAEIIYWDSDAFLGWLQNERGKEHPCRATFELADKGEVILVTSALTIAEVLWTRNTPKISKDRADLVRRFFRRSYIRIRNVTRSVSESAQVLVWDHNIMPKGRDTRSNRARCEGNDFGDIRQRFDREISHH